MNDIYKYSIVGAFAANDLENDTQFNLFHNGFQVIFKESDYSLLVTNFQFMEEGSVIYLPFIYQYYKVNIAKWN